MSNNEQVCKHYYEHQNDPSHWCYQLGKLVNGIGCVPGPKRECFEPRERKKVKREVKVWAYMTIGDVLLSWSQWTHIPTGYKEVELTGHYEVEE